MSPDWNISLFHYRNHGADYGRVLVGMQVPPREMPALPALPARPGLSVLGRDEESGLHVVPGLRARTPARFMPLRRYWYIV